MFGIFSACFCDSNSTVMTVSVKRVWPILVPACGVQVVVNRFLAHHLSDKPSAARPERREIRHHITWPLWFHMTYKEVIKQTTSQKKFQLTEKVYTYALPKQNSGRNRETDVSSNESGRVEDRCTENLQVLFPLWTWQKIHISVAHWRGLDRPRCRVGYFTFFFKSNKFVWPNNNVTCLNDSTWSV